MSVQHLNAAELNALLKSDKPVLLDFYADWCGPCKMLAPILEEFAAEHPEVHVAKINVDQEPALAQEYNVMSIPTLVVLKNESVVNRATGVRPKAGLLQLLEG